MGEGVSRISQKGNRVGLCAHEFADQFLAARPRAVSRIGIQMPGIAGVFEFRSPAIREELRPLERHELIVAAGRLRSSGKEDVATPWA